MASYNMLTEVRIISVDFVIIRRSRLYDPQTLIDRISAGVKEILSPMPGVMVCLAGDLNQQKTDV